MAEADTMTDTELEMLRALKAALYGMDELIRSFTITHVVRGQAGTRQRRVTADEMSVACEASYQYQQSRRQVEDAIRKAEEREDARGGLV